MTTDALNTFLEGTEATTVTGFGKHADKTRAWLFQNDLAYAGWVVRQVVQDPYANTTSAFGRTALWLQQAFQLKHQMTAQQQAAAQAQRDAAAVARAEREARCREAIQALKVLRKSTADGQIARLDLDPLMHILRFTKSLHTALTLPRVCKELRVILGPLAPTSPRMRVVTEHVFTNLQPSLPQITGGFVAHKRAQGDDSPIGKGGVKSSPPGWDDFKILASKTLLLWPWTQMRVVRGDVKDFHALAARSHANKEAFEGLHKRAFATLKQLQILRFQLNGRVDRASFTGKLSRRKNDPQSTESFVEDLKALQAKHEELVAVVNALHALNADHSLFLHIPGSNYTSSSGETKLYAFLDLKFPM